MGYHLLYNKQNIFPLAIKRKLLRSNSTHIVIQKLIFNTPRRGILLISIRHILSFKN